MKKIYVWATDKFTTAMDPYKKTDKFVVVCDNETQAEAVEKWMEKEKIYKYINRGYSLPRFNSAKYFVSVRYFND